jgi:hypothetical protein
MTVHVSSSTISAIIFFTIILSVVLFLFPSYQILNVLSAPFIVYFIELVIDDL